MSVTAVEIIDDVLTCLKDSGHFADVRLGTDGTQSSLPRASAQLVSHDTRPADDGLTLWHRLRLEIGITTAGASVHLACRRALELHQLACEALRQDPSRGGVAGDLPWGQATQIGPAAVNSTVKPPMCQLRFELVCHYESAGGA